MDKIYQIALTLVPKVGDVAAKKLIAYCGSAEHVFKESRTNLIRIPGIGSVMANCIVSQRVFAEAESELRFIEQHQIKPIYFMDEDYPFRLKRCVDAPMLLYLKGVDKFNLNAKK